MYYGMNHRQEEIFLLVCLANNTRGSLNGFARKKEKKKKKTKTGNVLPAAISRLVLELVDVFDPVLYTYTRGRLFGHVLVAVSLWLLFSALAAFRRRPLDALACWPPGKK
jgi:hypothetical protein